MSDLVTALTVIFASLVITVLVFYALRGYDFVIYSLKSVLIASIFGGTASYLACYYFDPASALSCAIAGAISAMWASFFTLYYSS